MLGLVKTILADFIKSSTEVHQDGSLVFQNVELQPSAFRTELSGCFLKSGQIDEITFQVKQGSGGPELQIQVENVRILLGPDDSGVGSSEDSQQPAYQAQKARVLARDHNTRLMRLLSAIRSPHSSRLGLSLIGRLVSKIRFAVNGLHVRFEGDGAHPEQPFALGLTVDSFSLAPAADSIQNGEFNGEKLVKILGFRVYWQRDGSPITNAAVVPDTVKDILTVPSDTGLSAVLRLNNTTKELEAVHCSIPQVRVYCQPETLRDARNFLQIITSRDSRRTQMIGRPACKFKGNARLWWDYALNCVLEKRRSERLAMNLEAVMVRIKDINIYCRLYTAYLTHSHKVASNFPSGPESMQCEWTQSEDEKQMLFDLENGLPEGTVLSIRMFVERQLHAHSCDSSTPQTMSSSTICQLLTRSSMGISPGYHKGLGALWRTSWLFNRKVLSLTPGLSAASELIAVLTQFEELFSASHATASSSSEHWTGLCTSVHVEMVTVVLLDVKRRTSRSAQAAQVAELCLREFSFDNTNTLISNSFSLSLSDLVLKHIAVPEAVDPVILQRVHQGPSDLSAHPVSLRVSSSEDGENMLTVYLPRFEIVNSPPFVQAIQGFLTEWPELREYTVPQENALVTATRVAAILSRFTNGARESSLSKDSVSIHLDLPNIVIPAVCEHRDRLSAMLIVCLGQITARQNDANDGGQGTLSWTALSVLCCKRQDNWRDDTVCASMGLYLLKPTNLAANTNSTSEESSNGSLDATLRSEAIELDGTFNKLSTALECLIYAFAHTAISSDVETRRRDFLSGMPLLLSRLEFLFHYLDQSANSYASCSRSSLQHKHKGLHGVLAFEIHRFSITLSDSKDDVQSQLASFDLNGIHGSMELDTHRVRLGFGIVGCKLLGYQHTDGMGEAGSVCLLQCSSDGNPENNSRTDFLSSQLSAVHEDCIGFDGTNLSWTVSAGTVAIGLNLSSIAELQSFFSRVIAKGLPGTEKSVGKRLKALPASKLTGVQYAPRRGEKASSLFFERRSCHLQFSIHKLSTAFLLPSTAVDWFQFSIVNRATQEESAASTMGIDVEQVASCTLNELTISNRHTLGNKSTWSGGLAKMHAEGSAKVCGDYTNLFQMPASVSPSCMVESNAPEGQKAIVWEILRQPDTSGDIKQTDPAITANVQIHLGGYVASVQMGIVTLITSAIVRSEAYVKNSQKLLSMVDSLISRAREGAAQVMDGAYSVALICDAQDGLLDFPCGKSRQNDSLALHLEHFAVRNTTQNQNNVDRISTTFSSKLLRRFGTEMEEIANFSVSPFVERQVSLNRLNPELPRALLGFTLGQSSLRIRRSQMSLGYKIIRWNAVEAEAARRTVEAISAAVEGDAKTGQVMEQKTGDTTEKEFKGLDRRRVGVRVLDWAISFQAEGFLIDLEESELDGGPFTPFWRLQFGQLNGSLESWSDTTNQGTLLLQSVSMYQPEGNSGRISQYLSQQGGSAVSVSWSSDGEGLEHRFSVGLGQFDINFAPEPLLRVANFVLSSTLVDIGESEEDAALNTEVHMSIGQHVQNLSMPTWRRRILSMLQQSLEQDGFLRMVFTMPSLNITIWESWDNPDCSRCIFQGNVEALYHASKREHLTKILISNTQVAVRSVGHKSKSSILSDHSVNVEMLRRQDQVLEDKAKVSIASTEVVVSYQDVKALSSIASNWIRLARESGLTDSQAAHEILRAVRRASKATLRKAADSLLRTSGQKGLQAEPKTTSPGGAGNLSEEEDFEDVQAGIQMRSVKPAEQKVQIQEVPVVQHYVLACEGIKLSIMNDCVGFNVPFAAASVSPFSVISTGKGEGLTAKGTVKIDANFYNILSSTFEPIIEPFKFDLQTDLHSDVNGAHNVSIASKQRMEVNLCEAHLCSILATLESWMNDLYPHVRLEDAEQWLAAKVSRFWPYHLRNETGLPLRFWAGKGALPDEGTQVHLTAADGEQPFAFTSSESAQLRGGAMEMHCISISLDECEEVITQVPVDEVGVHMFPLENRQVIIVEITIGEGGSKLICVQSVVKVVNHCDLAVEFEVCSKQGKPVWTQEIVPGAYFCLPINLRDCYCAHIRPAGDHKEYDWSDRVLLPIRLQPSSVDWHLVTCRLQQKTTIHDLCFRVRVDAKKPQNAEQDGSIRAVLSIHPILKIQNALPQDSTINVLSADVADRSEKSLLTKRVASATTFNIHSVDRKTALGLVILIKPFNRVRQPALVFHPESNPLSKSIELLDEDDSCLKLGLDYKTNAWGVTTVVIFPFHLVLNRSGIPLAYGHEFKDTYGTSQQQLSAGQLTAAGGVNRSQERESNMFESQPFILSVPENALSGKLCLKAQEGVWSSSFPIESIGTSGFTELAFTEENQFGPRPVLELAFSLEIGPSVFNRCRVVTVQPRFRIRNDSSLDIQMCQSGLENYFSVTAAPGSCEIFYWGDITKKRKLRLRAASSSEKSTGLSEWSGSLMLDKPGSYSVRVPTIGGTFVILRANLQVSGSATTLQLSEESTQYPSYKVENLMPSGMLRVQQVGCALERSLQLEPGSTEILGWDEPHQAHEVLVHVPWADAPVTLNMDAIGTSFFSGPVEFSIQARGPTKVLRVGSPEEKDVGGLSMQSIATVRETLIRRTVMIQIAGIGLSLMNSSLDELMYLSALGVKAEYLLAVEDSSVELQVSSLQIDNQTDFGSPVLLRQPARQESEQQPMLHVSLVKQIDKSLHWYKYVAVSLQEMRVSLHESFLVQCLTFIQSLINASNFLTPPDLSDGKLLSWLQTPTDSLSSQEVSNDKGKKRVYLEVLQLHPIMMQLTFTPTGELADRSNQKRGGTAASSSLISAIKSLNITLPSIDGNPLCLNALILNHTFATKKEIRKRIKDHYKKQLLKQVYASWGGLNPLATSTHFSSSKGSSETGEAFYRPTEAMVRSPQQFKDVVKEGRSKLARSAASGASSIGDISRSVSKALSILATSEQDQASQSSASATVHGVEEGISEGVYEFRKKLEDAGSGLLSKPIQGWETDGVGGFLSGLGKGILGGVAKPTAGVFDLAAKTSEGFINAADDSAEFAGRIRPPRPPSRDGILRVYDPDKARGVDYLRRVNGGKYRHDMLIAYAHLKGYEAVLVTDQRVVVFDEASLEKRFKANISEISSAQTMGSGVLLNLKPATQGLKFYTEALGVSTRKTEMLLQTGDLEKAEFLVQSIVACTQGVQG